MARFEPKALKSQNILRPKGSSPGGRGNPPGCGPGGREAGIQVAGPGAPVLEPPGRQAAQTAGAPAQQGQKGRQTHQAGQVAQKKPRSSPRPPGRPATARRDRARPPGRPGDWPTVPAGTAGRPAVGGVRSSRSPPSFSGPAGARPAVGFPGPEAGGSGPGCPRPGPPGGPGCRLIADKCSGPVAVPAKQHQGRRQTGGSSHLIPQGVSGHRLGGDFLLQGRGFPRPGPGAFLGLGLQDLIGGQECLNPGHGRFSHRQGRPEGGHGYLQIPQIVLRLTKPLLAFRQTNGQGLDSSWRLATPSASTLGSDSGNKAAAARCSTPVVAGAPAGWARTALGSHRELGEPMGSSKPETGHGFTVCHYSQY